jgi:hypothetical protein
MTTGLIKMQNNIEAGMQWFELAPKMLFWSSNVYHSSDG